MSYIYNSRYGDRGVQKQNYEFNMEWMKYYEWVIPVERNRYKACCTLCNLTLNIGSNGHFSLLQHEKSNRHRKNCIQKNGVYCHDANNYVSGKIPLEYPNTTGANIDGCYVKIERIGGGGGDDDDDDSVKIVNPSNAQAPFFIGNTDKSPTDLSSMYQTNLPNCKLVAVEGNSSLHSPSKKLNNDRNTREFDDGSITDLPEINESSDNNSKLTHSDTRKNSTLELLDIITSPATDPSPNGGQSVSPAHNDDNVVDASVPPESNRTRTIMEHPTSYLFTPSPSVSVEDALRDVEMTFEISSSEPSVPSPPTAMEQTHQNAEMVFEIDSNFLTTPSASTAMKETHQNVEMTVVKSNDYSPTSGLCRALVPVEQNTEFPFEKCGSNPPTYDHFTDPKKNHLSELLDRYSESCAMDGKESRVDEKDLPKRSYLQIRKLPARSSCASQRRHPSIGDKSYLKNEVRSILERLDEAKRVYENKCRIIMDDYKIFLNKLSESDPTFLHSDILTPEYANSWNSLKLLKILLSEENSSEDNKQTTVDDQHDNSSNSNENFSTNRKRGFSRGHRFSYGQFSGRQYRKRGRKRTHEISRKIFVDENSKCNKE